ncbi:MAG: BatD family protein [Candidatus Omnitrophota bacterium]
MKKIIIIIIGMMLISSINVFAQERRLEVTLERNQVSIGNPVYLNVTFYGSQDLSATEIGPIDGLTIRYVGPSSQISIVNGQISQAITHRYLVIPTKSGEFYIGPFFVDYQGEKYEAPVMVLSVNGKPQSGQSARSGTVSRQGPTAVTQPMSQDEEGGVFLLMDMQKRMMYLNEIVPLTIKLYVRSGMGLRDIEYPTYAYEGVSTGDFSEPERSREVVKGVSYEVLTFKQDLFGVKEGDYVLGPAKLRCSLVVKKKSSRRSSFFGRNIFDDDFFDNAFGHETYPVEIESEAMPITILPFPEDEKPLNFKGAVGNFDLTVYTEPPKVKVGDPVVLKMAIQGKGNLDTVTAPLFDAGDKFKAYEPQATKETDKKVYEQIIIPKTDEIEAVPEISFSFFNPKTKKYETITRGPFPLQVMKQPDSERSVKMVSMPGVEEIFYPKEELGKDLVHIKDRMGHLRNKGSFVYKNPFFWIINTVLMILLSAYYFVRRKKQRILKDEKYARFLRAPKKARRNLDRAKGYLSKGEILPFYDVIFKTLQEYLGGRFNIPIGNVTVQVIEDRLRPAGCDEDMLKKVRDVFTRCEMARYASSLPESNEAEEIFDKVKRIIDYMEKIKL